MQKYIARKGLEREIARVNREIDRRIVRGYSYRKEAQEHKMLLVKLSEMRRRVPLGWSLLRVFSFF